MLRLGEGRVRTVGDEGGALVRFDYLSLGAVIGHPSKRVIREALARVPTDFDLIVQLESAAGARRALPGWQALPVTVHRLPAGHEPASLREPGVEVLAPAGAELLDRLPPAARREARLATAVAVRALGERPVSWCQATAVTETLWDVGVETLPAHRRRGHASACFGALASHMAAQGRRPVWGAEESNSPSLSLARKLGFEPVARLIVMRPR
jgi:GNAT superfamily N-acetyltransferase